MPQAARVTQFQFRETAEPDHTPEFGGGDDDDWPALEEWFEWSEEVRAEIGARAEREPDYDPWDDIDDWQADRYVLVHALKTTPAPHLAAIQLKARVAKSSLEGPRDNIGRVHGAELTEVIVHDLLQLPSPPPPLARGEVVSLKLVR